MSGRRRSASAHGSIPHHEREATPTPAEPGLPNEVREVVDALIAALGNDLAAIYWHGSYARGEAKPDSDHDLIIVLKRADDDVLGRMADIFREREEWSTYVQTEDELRQYPRDGRLQFHFGVVPLYGGIEPPAFTREDIANDIRVLARDIRFECRYRLLHSEPAYSSLPLEFQRARNARMLRYAAKLTVLALKARELLAGREYPATQTELRSRLSDADEMAVLEVLERWAEVRAGYEADRRPLALLLDRVARKLVSELPAE
ncbi:MAG TPA: nucleotidyltransferase domain-containing protein [Dehalococcoidia bacterium]|nr:nucleotidyltransferase domain-containing protein [Dehalococcoidia bacterium]